MENERNKFISYERVRKSGVTNMFDIKAVMDYSLIDLTKSDVMYIMSHYDELYEKYGNETEFE